MDAAAPRAKRRGGRWRLLPERGTLSLFELALLAVCVALVAVPLPQYLQDVVIQTFLWAGLALAWNIAGGFAGLISFGHAAFFGVGAYTSSILAANYGLTPWIGLWIGGLLAAAFGAVLTLVCARLRGPFFILSTLAAAEVVRIAALNWASLTGGAEGLSILPIASIANMVFESKTTYAALMLGYFVLIYAITKAVEGSRYGYYLFAARDDEEAASAAGVNPLLARTGAMCLSAFLSGIGGSLFAQYFLFLDPTHVISPELSFQFALLPALGGLGTAIGPVLGSFVITPLSEMLRSYFGGAGAGLHLAIYGGVLVVVMLYFPSGIAGALAAAGGTPAQGAAMTTLLEVRNLTRTFGALNAVAGVSFSVRQGELVGLIGPNGAGKSTLYNLIAGAIAPTSGGIVFKDRPVAGWKPYQAARAGVARTFQIPKPYRHLSVVENVALSAMLHDRTVAAACDSARAILADVGLADHEDAPVGNLTVGLLKRLEVARALALRPSLVLFDEIMAGLTPSEVKGMTNLVAALPARGITVIWVEHVLYAIMKTAPRIMVLHRGELIADDAPEVLVKDPAVIKAYLGEETSFA